jgi:hypothetical protein
MHCGKSNNDDVVAAHSNQLRDGKGRGLKAHDYRIAYLCYVCHLELDQGKDMSKQERIDMWEEAHRKSIGWLCESNRLIVKWNAYLKVVKPPHFWWLLNYVIRVRS